jgi:23S rRNA (uracil1939-C5)-methyltransferase
MSIEIAKIIKLSHDGRGIAEIAGKKVFIQGALPGEEVEFTYTKRHSKYDEGIINSVKIVSPMRAEPKCKYFNICGGCALQHMSTEAQLALKQETLLEQLQHFGNTVPKTIMEPITGPVWNYRHKARLSVKYVIKKDKLLIGFREQNGRYITEMEQCPILPKIINELYPYLNDLIHSLEIFQEIPQIEVAVTDDEVALIIRHLQDFPIADLAKIEAFSKKYQLKIYSQRDSIASIKLLNSEENKDLTYQLEAYDLHFRFQPWHFTQVNPFINQQLVARAIELLEPNLQDNILDLFCGLGNFTLPIAKQCKRIVGIEGEAAMVERAKLNAKLNDIKNAEFFAADLNQEIAFDFGKIDKIVLDPPRSGALTIVEKINKFSPERIVYVSCNPATLARDAGVLLQNGYVLEKIGIADMFPHTKHIETIALFLR